MEDEHTERTLSVIKQCHVYTLPPRPAASGWKCQEWPKTNHIFTGRVRIVSKGSECTVKLEDVDSGSLFAQCPLDNDKPDVSVEPVSDSSRYFVLRVVDNNGRHAFLGMGFQERNDAFEFNVTLADHVKQLRYEKESEQAAAAPAAPPQDFSLQGNISISVGGKSGGDKPRAPRAAAPAGGATSFSLAPPPPASGGGKRPTSRPVAAPAPAPAPAPAAQPPAPAPAPAAGDGWATFD